MLELIVKKEESGQTLEKYTKKVIPLAPLSFIYKLFRKKDVKVNGHWKDKKYIISEGDLIRIYVTDSQLEEFKKDTQVKIVDDISSWIIYEDSNILLINKPRGVLVQKDNSDSNALDEMVKYYLSSKGEYDPNTDLAFTPAPAHRIDRNTAGIVIFGKNIITLRYLAKVMQDKEIIEKSYLTLVKGVIEKTISIDSPLLKNSKTGLVSVSPLGKEAKTIVSPIKNYKDYTLVNATLLTGRTHQIRVHLASIDHPIIGDSKYGDYSLNKEIEKKYGFKNQFLVAYKLKFNRLEEPLKYLLNKSFKIDLPNEMNELLLKIEGDI